MKIPKTIKIGDRTYTIKMKRKISGDSSIGGQIVYGFNTMKIKKGMDEKGNEETFFHEVAHGILKELEFNHPKVSKFRNDEDFVQELGLLLRKTFLDLNKEELVK